MRLSNGRLAPSKVATLRLAGMDFSPWLGMSKKKANTPATRARIASPFMSSFMVLSLATGC